MKLQFDANQEYQLEAIQAVVDVFEGQPQNADGFNIFFGKKEDSQENLFQEIAVGNSLLLSSSGLAENTHAIQARNWLDKSAVSEPFTVGKSTVGGPDKIGGETELQEGNNFTVEMETGTGKTYVYLRTIHELYKTYGFKKFIIVVPSIAIKEGVMKNLEITKEHFAQLYDNPKMDYYVWDPKKRGQARQFATNDALQIMVINIDSFSKADNIINQKSDWGVPAEFIKATNPIVIVDEPQNMETEKRKEAIASLNPLCTLRYSATHKNYYNLLYKLDPVKAYDLGLVKKIEVDSVFSEDAFNSAYIYVQKIEHKSKSGLVAKIEVDKDDARGLQRQVITAASGVNLYDATKRDVYDGYVVDEINADEQLVTFSNGKSFFVGQRDEGLHENIVKYQIRRTIEDHLEKELRYQGRDVKVLSLFFIDRVANYRSYGESGPIKGKFARWFEEAYKELTGLPKYAALPKIDVEKVHNGYFSADKSGDWKDTRGDTLADDNTYELIMKDKERLLNNDEPLRFIFSHSALREGWDNPNVFQICTLNETRSDLKKRQEIGRGLRLPVNADGLRVRDDTINVLTVIANESYEDFAAQLQTEIEEDTGVVFKGRIKNKREQRTVRAKKGYALDENFKQLWSRIKHKTRYNVTFSSTKLVEEASQWLSKAAITKPRISSRRARIEIDDKGVRGVEKLNRGIEVSDVVGVPDVLAMIQARTKLTRKTIFEILDKAEKIPDILRNPQQVVDEAVRVINHVINGFMVDGIKYERLDGEEWEMRSFEDKELVSYLDNLVEVANQDKTLFDYVAVDSGVERSFADELENRDEVKFYFKLPSWFTIDTPLGPYNPDWAIIFEEAERVYFVAETKGTTEEFELKESEKQKIQCGRAHFDVLDDVQFKGPITKLSELSR